MHRHVLNVQRRRNSVPHGLLKTTNAQLGIVVFDNDLTNTNIGSNFQTDVPQKMLVGAWLCANRPSDLVCELE